MAGENRTFIVVPQRLDNERELRHFLTRLVELVDIAYGERADNKFITANDFKASVTSIQAVIAKSDEASSVTNSGLDVRVEELEDNLQQQNIPPIEFPTTVASAVYSQAEIQELSDNITTLRDSMNIIVERLKLANIIVS